MKKLIALLLMPFLLSGCATEVQSALDYAQSASEVLAATPPITQEPEPEPEEAGPAVFEPEYAMTLEETVEAYFEQQYLSYMTFTDIDLSAILDMRSTNNQNMARWTQMQTQRRKLILEHDFCYVEDAGFPYAVVFEEEPEDDRMRVWERRLEELQATIIHFRIVGEEGEVYPPMLAVNSQHSMMLRQVDGVWKIAMHYFPGSRRKFSDGEVVALDDDEMLLRLAFEFEPPDAAPPLEVPAGALAYDAEAAVAYAMQYAEQKNPDFHDIGDWIGNCANFVSQSVWAGFGSQKTTASWNSDAGAWNHVGYFWEYATSGQEFGAQVLAGVSELQNGDIVQIRPLSMVDEPDRFTHELIVVDAETLKLAQNTPAAFVYYSDLVNVETRLLRPVYLW